MSFSIEMFLYRKYVECVIGAIAELSESLDISGS